MDVLPDENRMNGGNDSRDSSPSTSRANSLRRGIPHRCQTIWEPVSLQQEWTIANFDKAIELSSPGMCLRSKPFNDETMPDIQWQLCLYPGGKREENSNNVSLFLKMSSTANREYTVRAEYKFYFIDQTEAKRFSNVNIGDFKVKPQKGSHSWGLRNIPKAKVTPCLRSDGSLKILCQIELIPENSRVQTLEILDAQVDISNVQNKYLGNIQRMQNSDSSDCVIRIDGCDLPVHKFLLSAHSFVFDAMFSHDTKERREGVINIVDSTKEAVEMMLHFLYSSNLPDNFSELIAPDVIQLADKYDMEPLKILVQKKLCDILNPNNVCRIFCVAYLHNAEKLIDACVPVFFMNSRNIMRSEEWATFRSENVEAANRLLELIVHYRDDRTAEITAKSPPHKRFRLSDMSQRIAVYGAMAHQRFYPSHPSQ
uniref:BTB domain-containing protein n=1 Tax=Panagrellus redivivus TaxID=6233 RepID=A0A7E4UP64_PANRE